jgi:hypothetical protein
LLFRLTTNDQSAQAEALISRKTRKTLEKAGTFFFLFMFRGCCRRRTEIENEPENLTSDFSIFRTASGNEEAWLR